MSLHSAPRRTFYERRGKRAFDIAATSVVETVTLPVQLIVAILVRAKLGSPVLFRQKRPGLDGAPFTILKFRTMTDATDESGRLLPDEARLTSFGKFLRSTSLDELPELLNVLKGEMSLVGPRPLLLKYLPLYTPEQARRHMVRPGVTGWAQVNGRNNAGWDDKLAMDTWYVDSVSFRVDLLVLWKTLMAVLSRSDISQDGHATAGEFTGS